VDQAGSALLSSAAGATLHYFKSTSSEEKRREMAGGGFVKMKAGTGAWANRMNTLPIQLREEKPAEMRSQGLIELSTISNGSTTLLYLITGFSSSPIKC
jgi:hypothetical protein